MQQQTPYLVGLAQIAVATKATPDEATYTVYERAAARASSDPEEWLRFADDAASAGRWRWWPTVAEMLEGFAEYRGLEPLQVEATRAYERTMESSVYTPEGGASWNFRAVRDAAGPLAAEAFLAAGGGEAFATTYRAADRRRAFVAAYLAAARDEPEKRGLPELTAPRELAQLEAPAARPIGFLREPDRGEARAILRKLDPDLTVLRERAPARIVEADHQRLALLREQAQRITEEA